MASSNTNHWETDPEYIELLNYLIKETENAESPMSIRQLAREFKEKSGTTQTKECLSMRIPKVRKRIRSFKHIDKNTKVKMLFALSASVNAGFLKELKKDAVVKIDKKGRITYYKANDGSLERRGDHSLSAKIMKSNRSLRSMINSYYKDKNDANAFPRNESEKGMRNLIEFVTEKCDNVNSPLRILQLIKEFNSRFGKSLSSVSIQVRIKGYCREIQKGELLTTHTNVQQLFGLSAKINADYLKKLRKDALVEVDDKKRIIHYTANDGSLELRGSHWGFKNTKPRRVEKKEEKNVVAMSDNSEEDSDSEGLNDDGDEYSSEEFDSEFDSDDGNGHLDETGDHTEPSSEADDSDNETPARNRSPTDMSIVDNFDLDPPTDRSYTPEETEKRDDKEKENDSEITENAGIKTNSGRLSKRRHLDSDFSNNQASSSETSTSSDSRSSKPAKQKKRAIEKEQAPSSSNQSSSSSRRSSRNSPFPSIPTESEENMENLNALEVEGNPSGYRGPRIQEMEDYDCNPGEDNLPENSSIDNRLQEQELPAAEELNLNNESQNTDNRTEAVALEPKPEKETLQNNKNCTASTNGKSPIKVEQEEVIISENPTKEVKPKTSHNSKIKFFEAMKSLILFLDTPSLSDLQSKIHQKIRNIKGSEEVFQNNELILGLEFMIVKTTNHSSNNLPKSVESVSLSHFLCHLKAAILNSKLSGLDSLLETVKELNKQPDLQPKTVPVKTLAVVLQTTMDNIGF